MTYKYENGKLTSFTYTKNPFSPVSMSISDEKANKFVEESRAIHSKLESLILSL